MDIYGFLWFFIHVFSMFFSYVVPFFQAMAPRWRFIFALVFLGVGGVCGEGVGFTSGFPRPYTNPEKDGKVINIPLNFTE